MLAVETETNVPESMLLLSRFPALFHDQPAPMTIDCEKQQIISLYSSNCESCRRLFFIERCSITLRHKEISAIRLTHPPRLETAQFGEYRAMARRSDHSREVLRGMALDAAERIIMQQGHEGLSARKVANEIGYTVGTLYLIFANLDDLIMHINARTLDRLHQYMRNYESGNPAGENRLIRLGQSYIHFAHDDPHRWALIFEHHSPEDRPAPDWYSQKIMRVLAIVEETLKPLVPYRSEREISQAARALWAGVHGICILGITQKLGNVGKESVLGLTESLIRNYLKGFSNRCNI